MILILQFLNINLFADIAEINQITFQDGATPIHEGLLNLYEDLISYLIFIFGFILVITVYSLYCFKDTNQKTFNYGVTNSNIVLEFFWTIIPSLILLVLVLPTFSLLYAFDDSLSSKFSLKIIGHQWYWSYEFGDLTPKGHIINSRLETNDFDITQLNDKIKQPAYKANLDVKYENDFTSSVMYKTLIKDCPDLFDKFKETRLDAIGYSGLDINIDKCINNPKNLSLILDSIDVKKEECYNLYLHAKKLNDFTLVKETAYIAKTHPSIINEWQKIVQEVNWIKNIENVRSLLISSIKTPAIETPSIKIPFIETPISYDSYILTVKNLVSGQLRLLEVDNRLSLPLHTSIHALITSTDVLHSWAIPSFGVKIDACPGRLNQISLHINRHGVFYGQCSEICGINHAFIPICVEVI